MGVMDKAFAASAVTQNHLARRSLAATPNGRLEERSVGVAQVELRLPPLIDLDLFHIVLAGAPIARADCPMKRP
jgi:hypothetical protein